MHKKYLTCSVVHLWASTVDVLIGSMRWSTRTHVSSGEPIKTQNVHAHKLTSPQVRYFFYKYMHNLHAQFESTFWATNFDAENTFFNTDFGHRIYWPRFVLLKKVFCPNNLMDLLCNTEGLSCHRPVLYIYKIIKQYILISYKNIFFVQYIKNIIF